MKELKYFNQLTDYTANKDDFEYPTVSYVEENTNVYYMEKPEEKRILTYTTTGASQQISLVYKQEYLDYCKIVETGEKLTVSGTGVLYYTFDNPGEHQVELKFKDDATTLEYAFYGCTELTSIPANLFSNNTAVTTFSGTFYWCSGITGSIPENLFSNNTAVTNFTGTFRYCSGLTGTVPTDTDGTPIYKRSGEGKSGYAIVTSNYGCFQDCTGLTDYSSIPSSWN